MDSGVFSDRGDGRGQTKRNQTTLLGSLNLCVCACWGLDAAQEQNTLQTASDIVQLYTEAEAEIVTPKQWCTKKVSKATASW